MDAAGYRSQSFWHATVPDPLEPRPKLGSDDQVDVAIVGAGYTGLWTAYYLKSLEPGLRVAIVEAEIAGFGASGRNGGWCLGTLAGMSELVAADRAGGIRLQREIFDTVAEVERVCDREGIDCHFARGGNVTFALVPPQVEQLRADVAARATPETVTLVSKAAAVAAREMVLPDGRQSKTSICASLTGYAFLPDRLGIRHRFHIAELS